MENKDNVAPDPINKSMKRGRWNSGSANLTFAGILIMFRGNTSDGIESAIAGIVKHVRFLRKSSYIDCMVIRTMPLDLVPTHGVDRVDRQRMLNDRHI